MSATIYSYNEGRCYITIESRNDRPDVNFDGEFDNQYVAVAHNVESGASMEVSNPRCYTDTLQWVLKFIGQVPNVNYDQYDQYLSERLGF
jgi:hypothetical protein